MEAPPPASYPFSLPLLPFLSTQQLPFTLDVFHRLYKGHLHTAVNATVHNQYYVCMCMYSTLGAMQYGQYSIPM